MDKIYDVIVLGAGPAGLAAGLYAGRSRLSVLILEKGQDGEEMVTFLYKLVEGICPDSFGINVARLANIPEIVLKRAKEMADSFSIDLNLRTPEVQLFLYEQLISKIKEIPFGEHYEERIRHLLKNVI